MEKRTFKCFECNHIWEGEFGIARPSECPKCNSTNIHRINTEGQKAHSRRFRQRRRSYGRGQKQNKN